MEEMGRICSGGIDMAFLFGTGMERLVYSAAPIMAVFF